MRKLEPTGMVEEKVNETALLPSVVDETKQNLFVFLPIVMVLQGLYVR